MYIFMLICMSLTATTELDTQQWVERILQSSGAHPMLILAMVTGLMAVGRQFAGPVIHRLHPPGVLLGSAVIATLGIYAMSVASGPFVYVAAILFAALFGLLLFVLNKQGIRPVTSEAAAMTKAAEMPQP